MPVFLFFCSRHSREHTRKEGAYADTIQQHTRTKDNNIDKQRRENDNEQKIQT